MLYVHILLIKLPVLYLALFEKDSVYFRNYIDLKLKKLNLYLDTAEKQIHYTVILLTQQKVKLAYRFIDIVHNYKMNTEAINMHHALFYHRTIFKP